MPRGPGQPDVSTSNRPGPRIDRTRTQTQPDLTAAATRRLTARHISWWRVRDSNPRPRRCERRALPTELTPRSRHAILPARPSGDKSPDLACHAHAHDLEAALSPKAFRRGAKRSRGKGKNVVVCRSDATSRIVCR